MPVSSIYIWSTNFSHSVYTKSEAKMASGIGVQNLLTSEIKVLTLEEINFLRKYFALMMVCAKFLKMKKKTVNNF